VPTASRLPPRPAVALRRHLLALTAGTLLPVVFFGAAAVLRLAAEEQSAVEARLSHDARAVAGALDREMAASFRALEALAGSERLLQGDLAGFQREVARADEAQPSWAALVLVAPDGTRLVDSRQQRLYDLGPSVDLESIRETARTGRRSVGTLVRRSDSEGLGWGFGLRVPVRRGGEVPYVLTALVSAEAVAEVIALGGATGVEWSRTVVDGAGRVVARTRAPERFVGQDATPSFVKATSAAAAGVYRDTTMDGIAAYVAFDHASLSGWTVSMVAPARTVEAPVRRSIQAMAGVGLLAIVLSAGAAFLVSRRFARAIESAASAADALARGGEPVVEPHRIAEVAQLGEALQRSAALLEERRRDAAEHLARAEVARAEAERSSRAKDEFLAMLGHELRNPLSPMVTALHLLRRRGVWGREHEVLDRQVKHLVRLVDDLLDVARVTRGKVELHPQNIALEAVVLRALEIASPLLELRRHRVVVDVPEDLRVRGDPVRLSQVVSNLLTNAARYTPEGGNVTVTGRGGEAVVVEVKDDGRGIAPEILERIFEPFEQGPRGADRAEGGLGLGLALVRALVEAHGGRVEARSDGPGRGSTFRVVLPPAPAGELPPPEARATPERRAVRALRVLVVDDNADAARLLADFLESAGHGVVVALDAPAALAAIEKEVPDVAVLDLGLPVMDGHELARRIRERLGAAAPPFVCVTGYGQARDEARSRDAGFAHHFVKPVDPLALRAAVEALGEQRLRPARAS
jgi:signal transduction histidine kinase/ActR/RegA family two-component response regulator